ncbi:MAG: energy-coupling factor transporter transmembrane component T [Lachnospiraceae bacterium]
MRYFDTVHPAAAAFCFLSVLLVSAFSPSPALQLRASAASLSRRAQSRQAEMPRHRFDILPFLLVAVTNCCPQQRRSVFPERKRRYGEALPCGIGLAVTPLSAVVWFRCFNIIMTSDKLLFLFGRLSPKIALLLSSALRFVPLFGEQARKIRAAQRTMGLYASDSLTDRLRSALRVYSALITWALENAVDTGSSMKGRGYGLKGRTSFSLFRFGKRDLALTLAVAAADAAVSAASAFGRLDFSYYPRIAAGETDIFTAAAIAAFALLSFLPFISEVKEEVRWRYCISKI